MSGMPQPYLGAAANDADAQEPGEWVDALQAVIGAEGGERAHFLLEQLIDQARQAGIDMPFSANTAYVNTIETDQEERSPGNLEIEERLRAYMRWNAMAMVVKANRLHPADGGDLGGHIGSFASLASLFCAGFNHFLHAEDENHGGGWLYLQARGIANTENRKVWVFCGDGEMDEVESMGAIGLAAREKLDNLVFVINCNLQRLDGPVRGNGKIIQELEGEFRGAGWNVIKLIWGSYWDPLLAKDKDGILLRVMEETVDGEYQNYKANDGAFVRKHFFGKHPKLLEMVANMTDEDIWRLNRGGHDPHKVYAAYAAAVKHKGQPTVILAKTIKGYGLGKAGQAKNPTHQLKKVEIATIKEMRDQFNIPIPDEKLEELPFYIPPADAPEMKYLHERRRALGGFLPQRRRKADTVPAVPPLSAFDALLKGSGEGREISTTMAFVRALTALVRDKDIGRHIVPIVPDEARPVGMGGMV